MKLQIILISLIFIFSACKKKDKLIDDKAVFIGTWHWYSSKHLYDSCDGDGVTLEEWISPETAGYDYSMTFEQKGFVSFYQNDQFLRKDRVVFSEASGGVCGTYNENLSFEIYLNEESQLSSLLNGCVSADSMRVRTGFPFDVYEVGCERYFSYFVKE